MKVIKTVPPAVEVSRCTLQTGTLSFWNSMIVAACLEGGVKRLYTEDFGGQPSIEGLEIVNTFVYEETE